MAQQKNGYDRCRHGGRSREPSMREGRKRTIPCGWPWAVRTILERNGVNVVYTRIRDVYDNPYEKSGDCNRSGADFFVSIHRNAMLSRRHPGGGPWL